MTLSNVSNAVQRYPLSPPLSPGGDETANSAKMHQQHREILTLQCASQFIPPQHPAQEHGVEYGSRPARGGDREAIAVEGRTQGRSVRKAYNRDLEYTAKANVTVYYGYHGGWADWQQEQRVSVTAENHRDKHDLRGIVECLLTEVIGLGLVVPAASSATSPRTVQTRLRRLQSAVRKLRDIRRAQHVCVPSYAISGGIHRKTTSADAVFSFSSAWKHHAGLEGW